MAYTGTATTGTGMSALMQTYFEKLALETLMPELVLYNLADKKALPQHEGKTIVFHRYIARSNTVSAYSLTEGGSGAWPTWGLLSATSVSATVLQYGDAVQVSDFLDLTGISSVVEDAVKVMGKNAAEIVERKTFEVCYGTSSIPSGAGFLLSYPSSGGAIATLSSLGVSGITDVMSLKTAVTALKVLNVKPKASGYYSMVAHPVQTNQLMGDSAWQSAYMYTDAENLRRGNVGRIYNMDVYESTEVFSTTSGLNAAGLTAYYAIVLGEGALGATELDGGIKIIVKKPNEYDTANPLNQWSSIGWKINFVPVILNPSCGRILVSVG